MQLRNVRRGGTECSRRSNECFQPVHASTHLHFAVSASVTVSPICMALAGTRDLAERPKVGTHQMLHQFETRPHCALARRNSPQTVAFGLHNGSRDVGLCAPNRCPLTTPS